MSSMDLRYTARVLARVKITVAGVALTMDKTRAVDIRVTDMLAGDAAWWDARLGPKHSRMRSRADRFWAWSVLLPLCHLVQLAKRRYCRPLVVWARADSGRFVRVGMSIFFENYPYLEANRGVGSHFVWFMSAADSTLLQADFGMMHPPALRARSLGQCHRVKSKRGLGRPDRAPCRGRGGPNSDDCLCWLRSG